MSEVMIHSHSVKETMDFGYFLGRHGEEDLFIALDGDLGAGKTHLVQGLAEGLGIEGVVASPTFTIMNYYEAPLPLKHFDFYRLTSADELYGIGWDEYSIGGVTVAEWASMFPEVLPEEAIHVEILLAGESERDIKVSWGPRAPEAVVKEIENYAASH